MTVLKNKAITADQGVAKRKAVGWIVVALGTVLFIWNLATSNHGEGTWIDWGMVYFFISIPIWAVGFGLVVLHPRDLRSEPLKLVEALEQEVAAADYESIARIKIRAELVQKALDNDYHSKKMTSTHWIALSERVHAVFAICDTKRK